MLNETNKLKNKQKKETVIARSFCSILSNYDAVILFSNCNIFDVRVRTVLPRFARNDAL